MAVAANNRDAMAKLLAPILTPKAGSYSAEQMTAFARWLDVLGQRNVSTAQLAEGGDDELRKQLAGGAAVYEAAVAAVGDANKPLPLRVAAAGLLAREPATLAGDLDRLAALLTPQTPPELQRAALASMARLGDDRVPALLVGKWATHSPEVRLAATDLMLAREPWAFELLSAVESKKVVPQDLDVPRRQRLLGHESQRVRELAGKYLGGEVTNANRQKVI